MYATFIPRADQRRGVILVVVVCCLALFAVVGVSFVLYAESEANASRAYKETQMGGRTDVNVGTHGVADEAPPIPTELFNSVLGSIIFDVPTAVTNPTTNTVDTSGVRNAFRGQGIARNMWGWNGTYNAQNTLITDNADPYCGYGRFQETLLGQTGYFPNYTYFPSGQLYGQPGDGFIHDPEFTGTRPDPTHPMTGSYISGAVAYTYPDISNLFLGAIRPSDGQVLMQSYFRPWLFSAANPPVLTLPTNPNDPNGAGGAALWQAGAANAKYKYQILRPRPVDHVYYGTTQFPYPQPNADGSYGDVENVEGKRGGRQLDSMWMDPDLPVRKWRGRNYKALVAVFITDLDSAINANVIGNYNFHPTQPNTLQRTNQGWGSWEISPDPVLPNSTGYLLNGTGQPTPTGLIGRYGPGLTPGNGKAGFGVLPFSFLSSLSLQQSYFPSYSSIDYDGDAGGPIWPMPMGTNSYPVYPHTQTTGYLNAHSAELTNHPSSYNPYIFYDHSTPLANLTGQANRRFRVDEMRALRYRFNGDDALYASSDLGTLFPSDLGAGTKGISANAGQPNSRFNIGTISNDLDRVAVAPWVFNYNTQLYTKPNQVPDANGNALLSLPPTAPVLPPPALLTYPKPANPASPAVPASSDFNTTNWTSVAAHVLSAIDLNRPLTDYRGDITKPFDMLVNGQINGSINYQRATFDRQQLATDIFNRLVVATGLLPPPPVSTTAAKVTTSIQQGLLPLWPQPHANNPPTPAYRAARWLAQLSVNIVDYIDNDDYMTPFVWDLLGNPGDILFGVELPRLVINEVYTQYENDQTDMYLKPPAPNGKGGQINQDKPKATKYDVKTWVELYNPLTPPGPGFTDPALSYFGGAPLKVTINNTPTPVYRIMLLKRPSQMIWSDAPPNPSKGIPLQNNTPPLDLTFNANNALLSDNLIVPDLTIPGSKAPLWVVQPSNATQPGFYTVGPAPTTAVPPNWYTPAVEPFQTTPALPKAKLTYTDVTTTTNCNMTYQIQGPNPAKVPPLLNGSIYLDKTNTPYAPTVLLQRLANPAQPQSPTNPYITVDVFENTSNLASKSPAPYTMNIGLSNFDLNEISYKPGQPAAMLHAIKTRFSYGRPEPYVAEPNLLVKQQPAPVNNNDAQHTFNVHNSGKDAKFLWLTHLDRPLISPIELFTVSACPSAELTHRFVMKSTLAPAGGQPTVYNYFQHLANWQTEGQKLYRALSWLHTRSRIQDMPIGGRVPGRVNPNTVWETVNANLPWYSQTFAALTYNAGANTYTPIGVPKAGSANDINTSWSNLQTFRTPGLGTSPPSIGQNDQPFLPAASPAVSLATGLQRTLATPTGTAITKYLWEVGGTGYQAGSNMSNRNFHPYVQSEMLRKVYNNLTTRSNTYAVWMTVGYFEVRNPGPYSLTNTPILGKELGSDDGTLVRHKFFAIVDRTRLSKDSTVAAGQPPMQGMPPVQLSYEPMVPPPAAGAQPPYTPDQSTVPVPTQHFINSPITVTIPALGGSAQEVYGVYDGQPWQLAVGNPVYIGSGLSQETVKVTSITPPPPPTAPPSALTGRATLTLSGFSGSIPHYRGEVLEIRSTSSEAGSGPLGNPGPQPAFNYRNPRYQLVVPYAAQIR